MCLHSCIKNKITNQCLGRRASMRHEMRAKLDEGVWFSLHFKSTSSICNFENNIPDTIPLERSKKRVNLFLCVSNKSDSIHVLTQTTIDNKI